MFKWIAQSLGRVKSWRSRKRSISPREFQRLADELTQMASVAERVMPDNEVFNSRVKKIKKEMNKLSVLAGKKEFTRLPPETRLELIKSLKQSRCQLMETMHLASPPTDTLQ